MVRSAIIALAMLPASAAAQDDPQRLNRGNHLYQECKPGAGRDVMYCLGRIVGIIDGFELAAATGADPRFFCRPSSATNGQALDVVVGWLERNADKRDAYIPQLVVLALHDAWPCENGPNLWIDPASRNLTWRPPGK